EIAFQAEAGVGRLAGSLNVRKLDRTGLRFATHGGRSTGLLTAATTFSMRTQADRIEVDHDHPRVTMQSISNGQSKQGLIRLVTAAIAAGLAVVGFGQAAAQEQLGDPDWRPKVLRPAYAAGEGPRIVLDAAHGSRQTIDGRYAGFAALMRADGYRIEPGQTELDTASALREVSILVISNAASPRDGS